MKGFLLLMVLIPTISSFAGSKVIYGEDNRVDVYAAPQFYQQLADSTAAMISLRSLTLKDGQYSISGRSLEQQGVCKSERFADQITAARCSGFLVGDDLLVTAGHCMSRGNECADYAWVFDYFYNPDDSATYNVSVESVYKCQEVLVQNVDSLTNEDYSLLRLERSVVGRSPLPYRHEGKITDRTELAVIGHPSGLPAKVATGAYVRRNDHNAFFVANLDTYGGNSGSAVFDAYTGVVEGILVRGESDYVYNAQLGCTVSKVCDNEGCRGEDVSRITTLKKLMEI